MLPQTSPLADRLRDSAARLQLTPGNVAALVVLASCACAGLVALWWTARPVPAVGSAPPLAALSSADPTAMAAPRGAARSEGPVVVHVSGAVASEGVIELAAGARVIDAIEAAGGARRRARTDQLNLARVVRDGEQIHVPVTGSPVAASGGPPVGAGTAGTADAAGPAVVGTVNLNTATAIELEALPDVGPVLAGRIMAHRDAIGGFTAPEQLLEVEGIGDKTFAALRDLVTM